jgi:hypothetical protein
VYVVALLLVSSLIFVLLLQINRLVALLFLVAAVVFVPALVIHRREMAATPELGPHREDEGLGMGFARLAGVLGLDTTGIALGALLLILIALAVRALAHL